MEKVKLTDICDFQGGSQPPKEEWSFDEQEGYIRMLQIRDFTQGERVTPEYIKISNTTKMCEANDILIARYGASIGKILTGLAGAYNVAIMRTIPDTSRIKKLYLYYYLKSPYFQNAILNVGSRAAQAGFNKEDLSKLDIECPELIKQDKIIAVLEKLECIIEKRKIELSNLDDLIKARFVEMFGSPVSNPMSWEKRTLKEVCIKLNDGSHFSPESFETGDYKYVTAKNIKFSGFDFSNITYVPEAVHRPIFDRCNPEFEDVLYIKDGATTGVAIVNTLDEEFTLLSSVALLKQDRSIMNGYFLATLLNNKDMYLNIRNNMGGAAITRLTIAKLNAIEIIVPPIELQNQFAAFVAEVDKSKLMFQKLHQKLNILQQKAGDI